MTTHRNLPNKKDAAPSILGAAVLLGATALASRVLGLIRDRMLAGTFGAGVELDVYYAAFRIPDLIFSFLVLGALSAGFIPLFLKHYPNAPQKAWAFANNVLHLMGILLIVLSALGMVAAPWIMRITAPGFPPEVLAHATDISRIMYLSTIFLGFSSVFGGILQGLKRFTLYAVAPLFYNIGIIAGTTIASLYGWGIEVVAWGVVLGAFLHLVIQVIGSIQAGWRYGFVMQPRTADVRELSTLMIPRVVGLALSQVNLIVMTAIASLLSAGSVAIFHFANNIQYVPIGIVGISFAIAAFPTLSEQANKGQREALRKTISETTRTILFLIVPLSVVFLLLRIQIVRVVLGAGTFGWNETIVTAHTIAFFVLSLFAQALIPLLVRVFFAWQNTLTPALIALVSAAINIGGAWMWSQSYGIVGIAMAFSLASIVQLVLLWALATRKMRGLDEGRILNSLVTISIAAVMAGLMIQATKNLFASVVPLTTFFAVLGQGLVAGAAGIGVYLLASWIWRSPELEALWNSMRRKLFRRYRLSESADAAIETSF